MPQIDTGPGNSTIQAYLQSKALAQSRERMQQMHDEAQQQLKELHEYHSGQLDIQQKQLDLAKQTLSQHMQEVMMKGLAGGELSDGGQQQPQQSIAPNQLQPPPPVSPEGSSLQSPQNFQSVQPQGTPITFNDPYSAARSRTLNVRGPAEQAATQIGIRKQTLQELGPEEAKQAAAVETAKGQAQLALESSPQAAALRIQKNKFEMDKLDKEGLNKLAVARVMGNYGVAEAKIHERSAETVAHIANDLYQDPDVLQGAFNGILGGQGSLKDLPPKTKLGVERMFSQTFPGGVVPSEKDEKVIGGARVTEDLLRQYLDGAKKYSIDGAEGGRLKAWRTEGAWAPTKQFPTDIRAWMDSMEAQGGKVASAFEGNARITNLLVGAQQKGLFDPYRTMKQNIDAINAHWGTLNTEIRGALSGMPAEEANVIMGRRGIHFGGYADTPGSSQSRKPDWLANAPKMHPKLAGYTLNELKSIGAGKPIYDAPSQ